MKKKSNRKRGSKANGKENSPPAVPVQPVPGGGRKRTPLERFHYIFQRIKEQKLPYPNGTTLGRELEISPKAVRRDIDGMASAWGLPIDYDPVKHAYYFMSPVERFPGTPVTDEELRSLSTVAKAIEQQRGPAAQPEVKNVYDKCKQLLNGHEQAKLQDMNHSTSYRPFGAEPVDAALLAQLDAAIRDKREVQFKYRGLEDGEYRVRRVRPFHQTDTNGRWYLIARDIAAKDERNFVLSRMRAVQTLPETFTDVLDLKKYFEKRLGIYGGKGDYRIRIEMNASLTKRMEGREWQPTQVWTREPSGVSHLHLRLSSLEEIAPIVLGWGPEAIVREPLELRERIATAAKKTWELYQ